MSKLDIITLNSIVNNEPYSVSVCVLETKDEIILFDCGFINSYEQLQDKFIKHNLDINKLTTILVTHHDHDHIANLKKLQDNYHIKVLASPIEKEYLEQKLIPIRIQQANEMQNNLPDEMQEWGKKFIEMLKSVEAVIVDDTILDNTPIIIAEQTIIPIFTPGHLPGHTSYYLPQYKTMIAGDALAIENNKLVIANPEYADDLEQAKQSVYKLFNYDIDTIICYHGGKLRINNDKKYLNI